VSELHLGLEVADRAETADDDGGADPVAEVDGQPIEGVDDDPLVRPPAAPELEAARASRITATRSSADRSGCLRGFARTATTTRSKTLLARPIRPGGRS